MLKRTPLFAAHQRLGGKLIEFGGWEMPVQYSSIVDEHHCVRKASGIFDICHMGEVFVEGPGAEEFLNRTLTNDVRKLVPGLGQYSLMCNERGGVVDDLYVYRLAPEQFLLIINASRIEADVAWLQARAISQPGTDRFTVRDASAELGAIAIQGPRVVQFIGQLFPGASSQGSAVSSVLELKKNQIGAWLFAGTLVWVARTGYTGEDGFEVVAPAAMIEALWNQALALGHVGCLQPCGLGARDTLRTEVCYPLYGHELDEVTTPIEAGVGFFVALDKGDFVGRAVLADQKAAGTTKKLAAFRMTDRSAPPRPGYAVWHEGVAVGTVVSGTQSPTLNAGIGLAYVPPALAAVGSRFEIEIRGKRNAAEVIKRPFYRKA